MSKKEKRVRICGIIFMLKTMIIKNIGALNREVATVRGFCRVNKSFARYPI